MRRPRAERALRGVVVAVIAVAALVMIFAVLELHIKQSNSKC
jgi:hypothetical protein